MKTRVTGETSSVMNSRLDVAEKETGDLNRPMSITQNTSVINNLLKQKAPGPSEFTGDFYQTSKEESIPAHHSLTRKTEAEETLPLLIP